MKTTIEFDLPEDREDLDLALKAGALYSSLWDVSQKVFRPARKHGYSNPQLQKLLDKLDDLTSKHAKEDIDWPTDEYGPLSATDLISLLEKEFYTILDDQNIKLY